MSRNLAKRKPPAKTNTRGGVTDEMIEKTFAEPRSPLIQAAFAARKEYLEAGGTALEIDEINAEVAERRGGTRYC